MASRPSMSILGDRIFARRNAQFSQTVVAADVLIGRNWLVLPRETAAATTFMLMFECDEAYDNSGARFRYGNDARFRPGLPLGETRQRFHWRDRRSTGLCRATWRFVINELRR